MASVLVVAGAACTDDSPSGDSAERESTTTEEPRELSVSTPEGEVGLNLDGELPEDWPEDFPLPDDAEPAGSGTLARSDEGVMVGVFTTGESGKDAFEFFTSDETLEPSDQKSAGLGSGFVGSVDIAGEFEGSVTVAAAGDTTYIVVVLTTEGTGSESDTGSGSTTTTSAGTGSSSTTTEVEGGGA
jgi:hypothetical protein